MPLTALKNGLIWLSMPSGTFFAQIWPKNEAQNGQEGPKRVIFKTDCVKKWPHLAF